jgi:hypothetical protein
MGIEGDIDAILRLIPSNNGISDRDARQRLRKSLNARQLRTMRADLESLTPEGLKKASLVGPAGLSKFEEARAAVKAGAAEFAASFQNLNDAVVCWLAQHPDGRAFLQAKKAVD